MVRELLMREWDPIGVKDAPEAQDEYDAYAAKAYVMIMHEGASTGQIADYLYLVETEHMGLGQSKEAMDRAQKVAISLTEMKVKFEGE
jgi:ABC-type transporter Mla maintaining outer membrane lipid asymmetry ATPase subunit MlaF